MALLTSDGSFLEPYQSVDAAGATVRRHTFVDPSAASAELEQHVAANDPADVRSAAATTKQHASGIHASPSDEASQHACLPSFAAGTPAAAEQTYLQRRFGPVFRQHPNAPTKPALQFATQSPPKSPAAGGHEPRQQAVHFELQLQPTDASWDSTAQLRLRGRLHASYAEAGSWALQILPNSMVSTKQAQLMMRLAEHAGSGKGAASPIRAILRHLENRAGLLAQVSQPLQQQRSHRALLMSQSSRHCTQHPTSRKIMTSLDVRFPQAGVAGIQLAMCMRRPPECMNCPAELVPTSLQEAQDIVMEAERRRKLTQPGTASQSTAAADALPAFSAATASSAHAQQASIAPDLADMGLGTPQADLSDSAAGYSSFDSTCMDHTGDSSSHSDSEDSRTETEDEDQDNRDVSGGTDGEQADEGRGSAAQQRGESIRDALDLTLLDLKLDNLDALEPYNLVLQVKHPFLRAARCQKLQGSDHPGLQYQHDCIWQMLGDLSLHRLIHMGQACTFITAARRELKARSVPQARTSCSPAAGRDGLHVGAGGMQPLRQVPGRGQRPGGRQCAPHACQPGAELQRVPPALAPGHLCAAGACRQQCAGAHASLRLQPHRPAAQPHGRPVQPLQQHRRLQVGERPCQSLLAPVRAACRARSRCRCVVSTELCAQCSSSSGPASCR